MIDYMEKGKIINGQYYASKLKQLKGSNQVKTQKEAESRCVLAAG